MKLKLAKKKKDPPPMSIGDIAKASKTFDYVYPYTLEQLDKMCPSSYSPVKKPGVIKRIIAFVRNHLK